MCLDRTWNLVSSYCNVWKSYTDRIVFLSFLIRNLIFLKTFVIALERMKVFVDCQVLCVCDYFSGLPKNGGYTNQIRSNWIPRIFEKN